MVHILLPPLLLVTAVGRYTGEENPSGELEFFHLCFVYWYVCVCLFSAQHSHADGWVYFGHKLKAISAQAWEVISHDSSKEKCGGKKCWKTTWAHLQTTYCYVTFVEVLRNILGKTKRGQGLKLMMKKIFFLKTTLNTECPASHSKKWRFICSFKSLNVLFHHVFNLRQV